MTDREYIERYDFLCEKRLRETDAFLHTCFRNSVFSIDLLLANYKNIFPFYTDHTFEHSEQVIRYCNIIAGPDIIDTLNPDELYILLMGASLHDIGMGISVSDFWEMCDRVPGLDAYMNEHPGESLAEYTRVFHQDFSALFVEKYSELFEIPSQEYIYCIAQVARGHRHADFMDTTLFPTDYVLSNGRRVNLAYITALVKLADELDVTSDRNLMFNYNAFNEEWSAKQTMCYKCHGAIKKLEIRQQSLILYYATDEPAVEQEILRMRGKVESTFAEYDEVVKHRTGYISRIRDVGFMKIAP